MLEITHDSIGRPWIICPHCGRKTPGWGGTEKSGGVGKRGYCRWCNGKWGDWNF